MNIDSLLTELKGLTGAELEKSIIQLMSYVKEFEGESQIKPIEKALPILCKYLLYDDGPYIINSCMVSIFRRVNISKETIEEIINLYRSQPSEELIFVLGNLSSNEWNEEIEDFVVGAMDQFPIAVIGTLYAQSLGTLKPETLDLIYKVFLNRKDYEKKCKIETLPLEPILATICYQTRNGNYKKAEKSLKIHVVKYLSFSTNQGLSIFKLTTKEGDSEIRLETVKSLERSVHRNAENLKLLQELKKDENPEVQNAAKKVLDKFTIE